MGTARSPAYLCLVLQRLTPFSGPRQDGRYGGPSPAHCLASVCPSVKGLCFRETLREGVEEALGLPDGLPGSSGTFLRPLLGCASCKIDYRSDEASLRFLRAPQLTSHAGTFRAEALYGEGGDW